MVKKALDPVLQMLFFLVFLIIAFVLPGRCLSGGSSFISYYYCHVFYTSSLDGVKHTESIYFARSEPLSKAPVDWSG